MTRHSFCSMVICLPVILLSGCEAVLNSLVNEPLFSAGDEWYDGQTYQIVKISACSYEFEEDSEYVTLKENSKVYVPSAESPLKSMPPSSSVAVYQAEPSNQCEPSGMPRALRLAAAQSARIIVAIFLI